jgi:hypothetical protein
VKLLFWFSIFIIFYAYLLYPIWLFLRARLYPPLGIASRLTDLALAFVLPKTAATAIVAFFYFAAGKRQV